MFKNLSRSLFILLISFSVHAADTIAVNPDMGKPGEPTRVPRDDEFKVCADQDNLPYSNDKGEGFENKIAEVLAADLGKELSYQFWHDRFGFLRNTLNAKRCDVIIGTNTTYDALDTTKPYYRAGHVWIYREDSGYDISSWDSPDLKKGVIGLVDKSPVTQALNANGLMANARPYRIQRDLTRSPGEPVEDVISGKIDVAIMWGPLGGYYAKQSDVDLVVVEIPEYSKGNKKLQGKTYWNISAGVRKREVERREMVEGAIFRNLDKIYAIMDEYGIPHTEPIFVDRLDGYKRHKK
ncbi:quinoprotein dehydrogenase-associated putative ABC transporter substrate-binding protein [Nitrosomonadales bacterium]|nr:quinoprotein dehydrogenase-associated putative ABC transporter substrate-binding protein [Methylophilaceae bacterium]MDA9093872.1 quinoprotein dehydrogenase-associated putative ABC transporter substrate-binding protein [Methylophilaceae bacterium]MDA9600590.1 quinoprotein dehydrogenase-associated putative ABC transporter substrate-binding protein [Nitrosomonadales bacterium]MDA9635584.1 quinoprotein dehydrogenase-associated putative ABC transporter substrate-binding protein [Nitrosomonadales 